MKWQLIHQIIIVIVVDVRGLLLQPSVTTITSLGPCSPGAAEWCTSPICCIRE